MVQAPDFPDEMTDLAVVEETHRWQWIMDLDRHRQLQVDRCIRIGTHTNRRRAVDVVITTTEVAGTIETIDVLRVTQTIDVTTRTAGDHHPDDGQH